MSAVVLRCALGDLDVSEALLRLPARGNWVCHLALGWPEAPTGPASLRLAREDGSVDVFEGTIRRSSVDAGSERVSVTLVGGAAQLIVPLPPRDHAQGTAPVPAGLVLRSIADAAGERLASGVEEALDAITVPRWTRIAMPAGVAVELLAWALGLSWRVLPDGSWWMGAEAWPAVDASDLSSMGDPADGSVTYAPDGAPLRPGTVIDGNKASIVEYLITPGRARARVGFDLPGDPPLRPDLDLYRASYAGTVRAQDEGGRLDLALDDPRLPEMRAVPLRPGLPGTMATVAEGARVRVAFEGADPRGAYASCLDMDPEASHRLALVDDDVSIGTLSGTVVVGTATVPVIFSFAAPAGTVAGESVKLRGKVAGPGHRYAWGVQG